MKGVGAPVRRGSVGAIVLGNSGSGGGIKSLAMYMSSLIEKLCYFRFVLLMLIYLFCVLLSHLRIATIVSRMSFISINFV